MTITTLPMNGCDEIVTGLRKYPGATVDYMAEVLNELEELEYANEEG